MDWLTQTVTVGTTRITVDIAPGPGTPLLLLHGIPGWRGTWHAAGSLLARRHHVIAPDLAGFGESDSPRTPMHALEHASAMFEMLDQLGVSDVHVAGFDFGGPIAVSMIRLQPKRVKTLTLLATNVFTDTPIPAPLKIARVPLLGEAAFRLMMGKLGLTMMWYQAVRNRAAFPLADYRRALRFTRGLASTRQVFVHSLRHLDTLYRPIEDALPSISVPTLVIWGDADPFFPPSIGRRTANAIPAAGLLQLSQCGHFVPGEYPELVADAIASLMMQFQVTPAGDT